MAVQGGSGAGLDLGATALGILSLVIWSLAIVVSIKYAILILRADIHGEGGVIAMLALPGARNAENGSCRTMLLVLGPVGPARLYGDGAITLATSVLRAVEGLKGDAPSLSHAVLPITVAILVALFLVQSRSTVFIDRQDLVWDRSRSSSETTTCSTSKISSAMTALEERERPVPALVYEPPS